MESNGGNNIAPLLKERITDQTEKHQQIQPDKLSLT